SESYSDGRCNLTTNQSPAEHAQECLSGDAALLIGDSHAAALSFGLREHLPLRQFTAWGCPPLFDHQAKRMHAPRCAEVQAARREVLQNDVPGTLLLHADWQRYLSETDAAAEALDEFLRFASKRWTVIVIGAVPNWQPSLPEYLIRTRSAGLRNVPTQLESVRRYDEQVQKLAQRHQARFVSLLDGWCTAASCVAVLEDGQLVSWDHSHLTAAGSRWVYETILAPELNAK
ncbi:MAG: SGNH hydrolase domain-containing protein, partial [Myxococcota bacterium]